MIDFQGRIQTSKKEGSTLKHSNCKFGLYDLTISTSNK